jgi:hypothetical protein
MSIIQIGMDTDKVERDFTRAYMEKLTDKIVELENKQRFAETLISELHESIGYNPYLDNRVELYESLKEKGNE